MAVGPDCPKYTECANADAKCHICVRMNCFKPGKNVGKGRRAEKKVKQLRESKTHLRKGSGAVAHAKGDLIDSQALYESKSGYTRIDAKGKASFALKREWLLKIQQEALTEGRLPILTLKFDGAPDDEVWAVVRAEALFDLLQQLRELESS